MKAAVSGLAVRPTMYNRTWRHLRFLISKTSIDDWSYMVGGFRGFIPGESTGLPATDVFKAFCPGPCQTGGTVLRLIRFLEGLSSSCGYDRVDH